VGNYTVWLYAGGKTSSSVPVTIENCSVHLDLRNSMSGIPQRYSYIGDSWTAYVMGSLPGANVKLLGTSNGTPWTIESWGRTGSDGSFTAKGTFPPGAVGTHALHVIVGAAPSNEVRFGSSISSQPAALGKAMEARMFNRLSFALARTSA